MRRLNTIAVTALVAVAAVPSVSTAHFLRDDPHSYVSPDARDSARQLSSPKIDLRSPDARDVAARGIGTYTPSVPVPQPSQPVLAAAPSGFDWGDAGIGAAGTLALIAVAAGTLLIASQRRRDRRVPAATR